MSDRVLQELWRHTINITKCEEASISWHESCLFVLAEKGLHIFEFSHNLRCYEKKINCIQAFIGHPKTSPTSGLFTDQVSKNLSNIEQSELIVDHALWPHNAQLMQEMATIIDFKWSPVGAVNSQDSAVAVMTNVGNVEIFKLNHFDWMCALELTIQFYLESGIHAEIPVNFDTFKTSAYKMATTAICWSPDINEDKTCFFITAQKSGTVILWLIDHLGNEVSAKVQGSFSSGTAEILYITWIPLNSEQFLLVCSNILGQVVVYKCEIQSDNFHHLDSILIWEHCDRMISSQVQYLEIQNRILLVINKHRHLVVLIVSEDGTVLKQHIINVNDYRITSITKANNIHVATVNCKIYILNFAIVNDEFDVSLELLECQGIGPTYECYSAAHSQNNVIYALSTVDRKVHMNKDPLKVEIILMSSIQLLDSLHEILLSNPTKHLTHYWDVLELLRYKALKTKEAPALNYKQLYETACSDSYILKVYLVYCTLCDSLKKLCKVSADFLLPEDSVNIVKEEILVSHADKILHSYYRKFQDQNALEQDEIEYFLGAKKFLEYFFQKSNKNLSEVVDPKILNIIDSKSSYICQFCDEEVKGFTCSNKHLNMFCALTFTPIDNSSYLVCKWCNLTASKDLLPVNPLCLFCDVNLHLCNE